MKILSWLLKFVFLGNEIIKPINLTLTFLIFWVKLNKDSITESIYKGLIAWALLDTRWNSGLFLSVFFDFSLIFCLSSTRTWVVLSFNESISIPRILNYLNPFCTPSGRNFTASIIFETLPVKRGTCRFKHWSIRRQLRRKEIKRSCINSGNVQKYNKAITTFSIIGIRENQKICLI
jgi:hypothetical protein